MSLLAASHANAFQYTGAQLAGECRARAEFANQVMAAHNMGVPKERALKVLADGMIKGQEDANEAVALKVLTRIVNVIYGGLRGYSVAAVTDEYANACLYNPEKFIGTEFVRKSSLSR